MLTILSRRCLSHASIIDDVWQKASLSSLQYPSTWNNHWRWIQPDLRNTYGDAHPPRFRYRSDRIRASTHNHRDDWPQPSDQHQGEDREPTAAYHDPKFLHLLKFSGSFGSADGIGIRRTCPFWSIRLTSPPVLFCASTSLPSLPAYSTSTTVSFSDVIILRVE